MSDGADSGGALTLESAQSLAIGLVKQGGKDIRCYLVKNADAVVHRACRGA